MSAGAVQSKESQEELASVIKETKALLFGFLDKVIGSSYTPTLDRVLLYPLEGGYVQVGDSGLYSVSRQNEIANRAVVVAVGPGPVSKKGVRIPMDMQPGNVVLFSKHSGEQVTLGGENFRLIKMTDILATVDEV